MMNFKTLVLMLLTVFLLSTAMVSALNVSIPNPETLTKTLDSTTITITNNEANDMIVTIPSDFTIIDQNSHPLYIDIDSTLASPVKLSNGDSVDVEFSYASIPIDYDLGQFSKVLQFDIKDDLDSNNNETRELTFYFVNSYCEYGDVGDVLRIKDVEDKELDNEDEWEWHLLDDIEIEVTIENTDNDEDIDGVLEYGIYNPNTGEFIYDDDEDFDIDDDDEVDLTLTFDIDPDDFDNDDDEYYFFIKAYSDDSHWKGEDQQCVSQANDLDNDYFQKIDLIRDNHWVIVEKESIKISEDPATCGSEVTITAKVWNIGDSDEEDVRVDLFNKDLGIDETIELGDLDIGEDDSISFDIKIPEDAIEKTYTLEFKVYDEDGDIFENDDDDESVFGYSFKVEGECGVQESVSILPSLESEAKAGEDLIVRITLTNSGKTDTTYVLAVSGYEEWAELKEIDKQTLTIDEGKSKDVYVTLTPNKDSTGDQTFEIIVSYGDETSSQPVVVTLEDKGGFGSRLTGFTIGGNFKDNWFIWAIAALNIILVLLIIVVAVRISRK